MALTSPAPSRTTLSPAPRRFGYTVAIGVNLAMLYAVNHFLEWEWPPFLTEDFEKVLPILSFSLVVTIVFNLIWMAYDRLWFKSIGNIVQSVISIFVTIRLLQVFPFDFSAYDFNWQAVTRAVLILALVGVSIAIVVQTVKLLAGGSRRQPKSSAGFGPSS